MKLIEQRHEILIEPNQLKMIELAGRVCYKSEDKITPESASKFVTNLVRSGHWSVLEHSNVAFQIDEKTFWFIRNKMANVDLLDNYVNDDRYLIMSNFERFVVSGNFRAWKEFLSLPNVLINAELRAIAFCLHVKWPEIFGTIMSNDISVEPLSMNELTHKETILHKRISVRLVTNRSCSHELVRHRSSSFSQESTRFVNYNKKQMEFIKPVWGDFDKENIAIMKPSSVEFRFIISLDEAEGHYKKLISLGWKPEQAREVLPNALKTELVMTDSIRGWYKILQLRLARSAHPQIRALMAGLLDDLIVIEPDVFEGLKDLVR